MPPNSAGFVVNQVAANESIALAQRPGTGMHAAPAELSQPVAPAITNNQIRDVAKGRVRCTGLLGEVSLEVQRLRLREFRRLCSIGARLSCLLVLA